MKFEARQAARPKKIREDVLEPSAGLKIENSNPLALHADVYDAEAWGLCGGLEAAATCPMISTASSIHVCLDNFSVAQAGI